MFDPLHIAQHDPLYPPALRTYLGDCTPAALTARGNVDIMLGRGTTRRAPMLALFCSVQCSSAIILQTYDLAHALCDAGVTVISGFHSPLEKECLNVLLDGTQPIIVCPARSIDRLRLPADWRAALSYDRLLLLSPFAESQSRVTAGRAQLRNEFVAALADVLLITHATRGGKIERFCHTMQAWGKPLLALDNSENVHLFTLGARPIRPDSLIPLPIPARIA